MRLGDQSKLPTELRENKGRNVFYALPLVLGLIGLFWQVYKRTEGDQTQGVKQFWIVVYINLLTGLANVLYLNQTPQQPRERDYAYAGSFYAYAIWCGLGVAAISDWLSRLTKRPLVGGVLSCLCILVPIQMAGQTWDDHDRSGRYTCRDFGRNYLQSLQAEGNPIIYTNGDNDTFPLWYAQETEEFRTDARVCNLSYLQTDWYIDQMKRPAYDSPAVPIAWKRIDYVSGTREGIRLYPEAMDQVLSYYKDSPEARQEALGDNPYELGNIIEKWVLNEDSELQIFPTDSIVLRVDKEAVKRSGMMIAGDSIPDFMHISLKGRGNIYKSELMIYEMLRQCNWERPIYVAVTVGSDNYGDLGKNFVQEGLAYRITPFDTQKSGRRIDSEKMYDNLMNRFQYGGLSTKGIYLDETVLRMCYTHRRMFATLGAELLREGKLKELRLLLEKCEKEIPAYNVSHTWQSGSLDIAALWTAVGEKQKAMEIAEAIYQNGTEYVEWYLQTTGRAAGNAAKECGYYAYQMREAVQVMYDADEKRAEQVTKEFIALQERISTKFPQLRN